MGVSMGTALEIFTNPKDLMITVFKAHQGNTYGFSISRGLRHSLKPLLSTKPAFINQEAAITEMQRLLELMRETAKTSLESSNGIGAAWILCGEPIDPSQVLDQETILWIANELRASNVADTSIIPSAAAA